MSQTEPLAELPWRGPGPDRPDLPLPPGPMPLRSNGQTRKVWRYVGVYGPEVMLCVAQAQIGPFEQSFWAVWDRERGERFAHTRNLPWGSQVSLDGPRVGLDAGEVSAELELGEATAIESICPSGDAWGWTRKRAGVPVTGTIEAGGRSWQISGALAVDDESAGYHRRHTSWYWSAGIGEAADGRALGWNLVTGINDPPRGSERAIWVAGEPHEPDPVAFDGLAGIDFSSGERLDFATESERARNENFLVFRSRYRHRFGTFSGSLGGIELGSCFGVMEEHEAHW